MRGGFAIVLLAAIFLAACAQQQTVCSEPYIPLGNTCCLDADANGVCDRDEASPEQGPNCELCPPKFVTETEERIVYRYVCANQSVVDSPGECGIARSNAGEFTLVEEHDGARILDFSARPACRGQFRAAEVHLEVAQPPQSVELKVRADPQGPYEDLFTLSGSKGTIDDEYVYIALCERGNCNTVADATMPTDGAFVLRALLVYSEEQYFTKEILVDPTPAGAYGQQRC